MTSVGHCGLEELVPILKRTIGEEQEFWVASPTSKILKLTQTHFTFSTFSLSLVVRTYINWLWRKKFNVLFRLYSCHKRKKCACVSCIRPVFLPWPRNYFLGAEYHCQLGIGDTRPNFHLWWITQTENLLVAHHPDSIWWSSYHHIYQILNFRPFWPWHPNSKAYRMGCLYAHHPDVKFWSSYIIIWCDHHSDQISNLRPFFPIWYLYCYQ